MDYMTPQTEALRLLEESLKELESPKGSVLTAVQKLLRASTLLGKEEIQYWCSIQLGEHHYVNPLRKLLNALTIDTKDMTVLEKEKVQTEIDELIKKLDALHLKSDIHYTTEELNIKVKDAGGGYISIGLVEERYADLVRTKRGNDRTYYKNDLYSHISYVQKKTHEFASNLSNQLKFSGTISNCFEVLKTVVDDKLLDLEPGLAEQLMLAFKGISSTKNEEWSQSLTTCRRLLEGLADQLYPANADSTKGRVLGQMQYVNRLWAFMDKSIESDSNKELAKTHVDFLGAWLEKTNKITNKGVHSEVKQLEAVKAVFHTYLVVADLLDYLIISPDLKSRADINAASIDEIEALLDVSRTTARAIIKARIQNGKLDKALLSKVSGIGPKTLAKAIEVFSLG
jgi:hypothetical protein